MVFSTCHNQFSLDFAQYFGDSEELALNFAHYDSTCRSPHTYLDNVIHTIFLTVNRTYCRFCKSYTGVVIKIGGCTSLVTDKRPRLITTSVTRMNLRFFTPMTTTTLNILNASRYGLQKAMTEFWLQASYEYSGRRNVNMCVRQRGRSLLHVLVCTL